MKSHNVEEGVLQRFKILLATKFSIKIDNKSAENTFIKKLNAFLYC